MVILVQPQNQSFQRLYNQKHFLTLLVVDSYNQCFAWKHKIISDANSAVDWMNKSIS